MPDASKSKAPSFYSAAADMAQSGNKPMPPGGGAGAGDSAGEETKIMTTLLEVFDKWDKLTKDPKKKEKIQQLVTLVKEMQSGMNSGGGGMPSADAAGGPTPDAGAMGGSGAPPPPGVGQQVPA